jgi:HSP20 family protein
VVGFYNFLDNKKLLDFATKNHYNTLLITIGHYITLYVSEGIVMQDDEKDEVLTAEEAAEYLKTALSTLYRFMRSGKVPCFKVGNQWRFKKSVLDEWMERMSGVDIGINIGQAKKETPIMEKRENKGTINVDLGLGGIFKGIGNLIDLASELAEKAPDGIVKEGQIGDDKGVKAVYGFSVKVGGHGGPTIQQFGNVREEPEGPVVDDVREPMVDTFDEGDFILVVAEMPGINESDAKYEVKGDILIISGETNDRKYYKELLLPAAIDEEKTSHSSNNGILEIKLWKPKQNEN